MSPKRSRWAVRLVLVIGSVLLGLVLAELAVRLFVGDDVVNRQEWTTMSYHINEGRELIPNSRSPGVWINSLGYRDDEFNRRKPPGCTRIVAVGDSVTFGPGLPVEQTFARRLETMLNTRRPGYHEVINGGVPDTGLAETRRIFERRDLAIDPDIVLVGFYLNDSRPPAGFRSEFKGGNWLVRFVNANPWTRRSRLFSLLYVGYYHWSIGREMAGLPQTKRMDWWAAYRDGHWRNDPAALDALIRAARFDWGAAWRPENWPEVEAEFRAFDRLCRAHGVRPALVAFPVRVQVEAADPHDEPQRRLARIADSLGWPYLDLLPGLMAQRGGGPIFQDHCHLTARGHELVAEMLLKFLDRPEFNPDGRPGGDRARSDDP
jgi:lysophospholipase L1-like esterase